MNEEKDFEYYESTIQKMLDDKYRMIALRMKSEGKTHDEIVDAIMIENAKDVHEAIHIGEDPSTN